MEKLKKSSSHHQPDETLRFRIPEPSLTRGSKLSVASEPCTTPSAVAVAAEAGLWRSSFSARMRPAEARWKGKSMGNPWENMGNPWEDLGKSSKNVQKWRS